MKHASTPICAARGPRAVRLARLVRGGVLLCVLAAGAAQAQRHDQPAPEQRGQAQAQGQGQPQEQPQRERFDRRIFDSREFEDRRRMQMQQEQNARNEQQRRNSGRLTPDERSELRRQINEAGMDLYPNRPRR
jgi:hypothetical protein